MKKPLVSIIIPTKNSSLFLENCLKSVSNQDYLNIEVLVIDSNSEDRTVAIAKKYGASIFTYVPQVLKTKFDAPHKRNYGVSKAKGSLIYYLDADMELPKKIITEAVGLINSGFDALVLPEDSFGIGIWAKAKQLERRCYWGDDSVEAARFFKKKVWDTLKGLDTSLGGGGDDWDLHHRLVSAGYHVGRTKAIVKHNEGNLKLSHLMKKRFMYGRDSIKYLIKKPKQSFISYFPIRPAYIRNWRLFAKKPAVTLAFVAMRTAEYCAGLGGILHSLLHHD